MERNLWLLVGHRAPCSHLISRQKHLWGSYKAFKIDCTLGCVLFAIKTHKCVVFPMALTCLATQPLLNQVYL